MIAEIEQYMIDRFAPVKMDGEPLPFYAPDAFREHDETAPPCFSGSLVGCEIDQELARPHEEEFIPSEKSITIQVEEQFGRLLKAQILGEYNGPFEIVTGETDTLPVRVGTADAWEATETIPLAVGLRDAWELAYAINLWAKRIRATFIKDRVWIETRDPGIDLEILASGAADLLGLPVGVQSHLTRTGPESYTVKPLPTPVILTYQLDLLTANKAQYNALMPFLVNVIPDGHWPRIGEQAPYFVFKGSHNLDELEKPAFRTAFRWEIYQVWLDALTAYQVSAILSVDLEITA